MFKLNDFAKKHYTNFFSKLGKRIKVELLHELRKYGHFLASIRSELDEFNNNKTSFCCNFNVNNDKQVNPGMEMEDSLIKTSSESINKVDNNNSENNNNKMSINWQKLNTFQNPFCEVHYDLENTRDNLEIMNRNFIEKVNSRFKNTSPIEDLQIACEQAFQKNNFDYNENEEFRLKNMLIGEKLLNFFRREIIERKNPNVMQLIEQIRKNF